MKVVRELRPRYIIEIGTANGGTLFLFAKSAVTDAILVSIDLRNLKYRRRLYESFREAEQKFYFLRANSHEDTTLKDVKEILNGNELDFVFIDGDHTYLGVKKDFEMYGPLVRDGGIIAFHDIVKFPPKEIYEQVNQFWSEIREQYDSFEIIERIDQGWGGIGVIRVHRP